MTTDSLRERKKVNLKKNILSKAKRLFRSEGIDSVSVNQIAEAAEISYATFFNYFPTKDDLFTAIYEEEIESLIAYKEEMEQSEVSVSASEKVLGIAERWWGDIIPYRVLGLRVTERFIQDAEKNQVKMETLPQLFEELINEGIAGNEFRKNPINVPIEAVSIYGVLLGSSVVMTEPEPVMQKLKSMLDELKG